MFIGKRFGTIWFECNPAVVDEWLLDTDNRNISKALTKKIKSESENRVFAYTPNTQNEKDAQELSPVEQMIRKLSRGHL
jgi:hypothetical protein